jgi:hypothetical protein
MGLFPLADTNNWLFSDPSRDRPAPVRWQVMRADVVWWWRTALPTTCPTAGTKDPSDDSTHSHHQARRPRTGPVARQASPARCIRRAAVPRSPHRTVAVLAERGPPPAASRVP